MDEILDAQYPCKHQLSCRTTYYDAIQTLKEMKHQ